MFLHVVRDVVCGVVWFVFEVCLRALCVISCVLMCMRFCCLVCLVCVLFNGECVCALFVMYCMVL